MLHSRPWYVGRPIPPLLESRLASRDNREMPNPFSQPVTHLGETLGRKSGRVFGIHRHDRFFHQFILGQTGAGKSTLIKNMVRQDLESGEGLCLIDPHGDLASDSQTELPESGIYWDVADPACPYGYNPLSHVSEQYRPLVASGIIDAFKNQWNDAWGVRMEHMLRFAILALLSRSGSSLADIVPMFTDRAFRKQVLKSVENKEVLKFWQDEYPKMNYKNAFDGVAPIANKLGAFLSHPVVRKSLCDPDEPIRFRQIMDEGTPLIVNLSKGRLGNDISSVMGGLILSMITNAAMTRENVPQVKRKPFFIYADEFSMFTTDSIASMLSELRKYKVSLCLAGQFLASIPVTIREAILGNVGNMLVFRLGVNDATLMSKQLGEIDPQSLINLPNYRMFCKLMVDGVQTKAFSAVTHKAFISDNLFV